MLNLVEKCSHEEHQKLKEAIKNYKVEVETKTKNKTLTLEEHMTLCFMITLDGLLDEKFSKTN